MTVNFQQNSPQIYFFKISFKPYATFCIKPNVHYLGVSKFYPIKLLFNFYEKMCTK